MPVAWPLAPARRSPWKSATTTGEEETPVIDPAAKAQAPNATGAPTSVDATSPSAPHAAGRSRMLGLPRRSIGVAAIVSAAGLALAGCASTPTSENASTPQSADAQSASSSSLSWGSCADLEESIKNLDDLLGQPLGFEGGLAQLQCATITVPLDYDHPEGRQIDIAISRTVPGEGDQVLLTNPGGPGLEGRTMPATLFDSPLQQLSDQLIVVGMDPRGTGASSPVSCPSVDAVEPYDEDGNELSADEYSRALADANKECFDSDPEFFTALTTQNVARDLDRVREALGVDQADYLGASWGTELGMSYLAQFPGNTRRMLLDSVMDPDPQAAEIYATVAAAQARWDAQMGTDQDADGAAPGEDETQLTDDVADQLSEDDEAPGEVADDADVPAEEPESGEGDPGITLPDGPIFQALSYPARLALTCNGISNAADEELARQGLEDAIAKYGEAANQRIQHPISADIAGVPACAGWPVEPHPIEVVKSDADVQLVGHALETVTPVEWAKQAHEIIGGNLVIIDDDVHASALSGPYAPQVVRFLLEGVPMEGEGSQS